jgi:hypothetical protein
MFLFYFNLTLSEDLQRNLYHVEMPAFVSRRCAFLLKLELTVLSREETIEIVFLATEVMNHQTIEYQVNNSISK